MSEQQSSYRQIIKATSIIGGVQIFNIIILIIRTKFIAVLLGPAGMGIAGLLSSTSGLISGLTNFGIGQSAVRNVSVANETGNQIRIATITTIIRRIVWMTGTLGSLVMLLLSQWLSVLTFGNKNYTFAFIWISITLLFNQLSIGQLVVIQGMRKLQYLARANLSGSLLGLIIIIPLYYRFGIDGIVPAIIITSIISLTFSWYYSRKIKIRPVKVSGLRTVAEGKSMLLMGFVISMSGLISLGTAYLVRIYINTIGGVSEVGLYTAGFAMISTYVGLIFEAMGVDYYPRLSAAAQTNNICKVIINQQAEIAMLILAPIIILFLVFIKLIVIILFSKQFIGVNDMIYWAALGMLFKSASWAIAFIFLAKAESFLFFLNSATANIYSLLLNLIGYKLGGLTGIGISFMINYMLYLLQVFLIARYKYDFSFNKGFYQIFIFQCLLCFLCFIVVRIFNSTWSYLFGSLLIVISICYSLYELDKRIGIMEILIRIRNSSKFLKS